MTDKLHIKVGEIRLVEMFQIKAATGRSLLAEIRAKGADAFDEEMVAGLIWIVRRREEPELEFAEVFAGTLADVFASVVIDMGDRNPPSSAASPMTRKRSRRSSGSTRPGPPAH